MIKSHKKFKIYVKKVKISSLNFEKYDKSSSNFEIFEVGLLGNGPKCGTVNGPALGLGFLLPRAAYTAYFVLYEAFGTVTNSRESDFFNFQ